MLLTRLSRAQLKVFALLSAGALTFVALVYGQVPARLGIGHYTLHAVFVDASGLYPDANVTYRGVTIGTVTHLALTPVGAQVTMVLADEHPIPVDTIAELHSTSAIGEQFIDLVPSTRNGPFLSDGDEIGVELTEAMPQIAPVLDRLSALLGSVPLRETRRALHAVSDGLQTGQDDLGGVLDGTTQLIDEAQRRVATTRSLVAAMDPVLSTQQDLAGQTVAYARALRRFADGVADHDDDVRALLRAASPSLDSVRALESGVSPTMPTLLANLTTTSKVLRTYLPNLEQTLVTYPALVAALQTAVNPGLAFGEGNLDLKMTMNNPPPCIRGYLSPSDRRSPRVTTSRTTDGTSHCQAPASGPESVRGLRNLPCPNSIARGPSSAACGVKIAEAVPVSKDDGHDALSEAMRALATAYVDRNGELRAVSDLAIHNGPNAWRSLVTGPARLVAGGRR